MKGELLPKKASLQQNQNKLLSDTRQAFDDLLKISHYYDTEITQAKTTYKKKYYKKKLARNNQKLYQVITMMQRLDPKGFADAMQPIISSDGDNPTEVLDNTVSEQQDIIVDANSD